ncbi:VIT1/CCC1 transporter family protein [Oceanicola sp. S124]|uniref:VIT1/CCC1 transporter family protein n=1 Tax=Oceanicola sp. S124 TaxID=1042378 RepID=UPI00025579AC|nr:VIT1/CCC1 transporter family protein [Oceanicola sp. S124]
MDWATHRREAHQLGRAQEYLRQIVYGGNDGIVTTFAIVSGFAGAQADGIAQIGGLAVLVFGLANLFADAVSMGLGEFLSGRAHRDLYHARRELELREIAENPDQERDELEVILRQRGLSQQDAHATAEIMVHHPSIMADLMMTYEFGMHDPEEDSPAVNGLVTFLSFLAFGAAPLVPYFLHAPTGGTFLASICTTLAALTALGLLRWNATGERLLRTLGETIAVGTACALVAYGVGLLVGG